MKISILCSIALLATVALSPSAFAAKKAGRNVSANSKRFELKTIQASCHIKRARGSADGSDFRTQTQKNDDDAIQSMREVAGANYKLVSVVLLDLSVVVLDQNQCSYIFAYQE